MLNQLLKHSWQNYWRSPFIGEKIFLAFLKVILFFSFTLSLFATLGIGELLIKEGTLRVNINQVGALILVYVLFDWVIRYLLQSFPRSKLTPYLALPIPSKIIVKSILIRSIQSIFFFLPFVVLIPLNLFLSKHFSEVGTILRINLFLIGSAITNHFLVLYIKYKTRNQQYIPYLFIGVFTFLCYCQLQQWIDLSPIFIAISNVIFSSFFYSLLPFVALGAVLFIIQNSIIQFIKVESVDSINEKILPIQFFSKYGIIGQLIDFELNMISRLKGTRSFLLLGLFFVLYPLILGINGHSDDMTSFILPFAAIFVSFGMVQMAQFTLAWHTYHFDAILMHLNPKYLVLAKWLSFTIIGFVFTLIGVVLYIFIMPWFIPYLLVGFLYNVGFTLPITLYLGIKYPRTKDPYSSNVFQSEINFQPEMIIYGLAMILGILIPFYLGRLILQSQMAGVFFVLAFSIICILFHRRIVEALVKSYQHSKYKAYQKFRAFVHD